MNRSGSGPDPKLACAWPRTVAVPRVRMITPGEFDGWIIHEDERVIVINKPADVVCHPSKAGPWSSLVGAVREYTGIPVSHLVFRLDRETSGVVVFAKTPHTAGRLQTAMGARKVGKTYLAVMTGELLEPITVNQPLGNDEASPVFAKSTVRADGQNSVTHFTPLARNGGFTLARVVTETGRKHQIRAHAQWLGNSLVGDKIYGPDDRFFLDFIDGGWTPALEGKLLLSRQALHCAAIDMSGAGIARLFTAPMPADMRAFCESRGIAVPDGL
ncbi:MAG: RNA pseudouridine synthase [Elusimicrobia bacterium CG_4_10_14_0_2_um_filter_56_8]|nr:MAG: RNA pseudouridine synthase [Elusimicrobia bacterium CG1_02_56_21]PJA13362.1 MAG: RNA pseudouridine synthase [Elusimicrobia bacterium CG_4_10_14_0_2_um_filter_56_8]